MLLSSLLILWQVKIRLTKIYKKKPLLSAIKSPYISSLASFFQSYEPKQNHKTANRGPGGGHLLVLIPFSPLFVRLILLRDEDVTIETLQQLVVYVTEQLRKQYSTNGLAYKACLLYL